MGFGVSKNIEPADNEKYTSFGSIYYFFVFFMFVLAPTSSNGTLPGLDEIIVSWTILCVTIFIGIIKFSNLNLSHFIVFAITIVYMIIITIISNRFDPSAQFSISRLAPVVCFLGLSMLQVNTTISIRIVKLLVHVFMIIFLVWNLLIIVDNPSIKEFTISKYTQLYEEATSNMFIKNRPVMSFGIYTFASYFYFLFFFINKILFKITNNKIYYVYMILLLIVNIMLVSNTAFVFSIIMSYYVFKSSKSNNLKILFILLIIATIYNVLLNVELIEYYFESFNSEANGFRGRYTNSGTLNLNLKYLEDNFHIGFNIVNNLTYSDSGYLVYYTMGGFLFMGAMYFSLYKFAKNNFSIDFLYFLFPTILFEFALPVIIYYKFIYASIFLAISYKSIMIHSKKNN